MTHYVVGNISYYLEFINTSPNNKISDWSKLEAFADDKINVTEKYQFFGEG